MNAITVAFRSAKVRIGATFAERKATLTLRSMLIGLGLVFHLSTSAYSQSPTVIPQDDFGGLLEGLDLEKQPPVKKPSTSDAAELNSGPAEPLLEAFESMQNAKQLFASDQPVPAIVQAQQRAIDLLDQLIKAAMQNQSQNENQSSSPSEPQPQSPEEAQPQPGESESSDSEGPSPGESEQPPGSDSASGEQNGDQGTTTENATAASPRSIDANGQAIWGHLPQRTRGMLRAEIPTEYLPKYSQQISDYFKALAEMPGSSR